MDPTKPEPAPEAGPSWLTAKTVVGAIALGGWIAAGLVLIYRPDTPHGELVFGAINGAALAIVQFYFGSSDGSAKKSITIASHLERLTPAAENPAAQTPYKMPPMSAVPTT